MKILLNVLIIVFLSSCTKTPDYILLSGKIENTNDGKITVRGLDFEKKIDLSHEGSFKDTLYIAYDGIYYLTFGSENKDIFGNVEMYLAKGNDINIVSNSDDFSNSILFTGKGSVENTYIKDKNKVTLNLMGDVSNFYSLDETDFISKVNDIKKAQIALLKKTKFDDPNFEKKELKNIDYIEQVSYLVYPLYQKSTDFKPSTNFPKFHEESINLDNDDDFLFSTAYKQLVWEKFYSELDNKTKSISINDRNREIDSGLSYLAKIKGNYIRAFCINIFSFKISPNNEYSEKLYNGLMIIATNDKFKEDLTLRFNKIKNLVKGKPSPSFQYENYNGGVTNLEHLKGNYVYIDVWATWCGPCKAELPFLKEIETLYKEKKIHFVSISVDKQKDREKWRSMVDTMKLKGIQLLADADFKSQFVTDYAIEGIPRFILLDPEGNIVSADAPRPSDKEALIKLFDELKI